MKDAAYCLSFDEHLESTTHWISIIMIKKMLYFNTFGIKYISKETKKIQGALN